MHAFIGNLEGLYKKVGCARFEVRDEVAGSEVSRTGGHASLQFTKILHDLSRIDDRFRV